MDIDAAALEHKFTLAGQGHVFRYLPELDPAQREALLAQAVAIDLDELNGLFASLVGIVEAPAADRFDKLRPAPCIARPEHGGDNSLWQQASDCGDSALRDGTVAAFTVAGGQGTRLGFDGPKGTFPVTPVRKASLFQVFAEKIRAASGRYGTAIPWYIMTSRMNHDSTVDFFSRHDYFGLNPADVFLFPQGLMPAIDFAGHILMEDRGAIAMSPDGHGGSLRALVRSGALEDMRRRGIRTISYFQVDNPLVRCIDPAFIGHHLLSGGEMTSKMVPKSSPDEKVGHFCISEGTLQVVEYSDMPESLTHAREADGSLRFKAGSIALHVLGVDFVERVGGESGFSLPFHRADKKIPCLDSEGNRIKPESPNGVKFEMFVFDALPLAHDPVVIETLREEDFSPVKNPDGVDSVESCQRDQLRQYARWARAAGADLEVDAHGVPVFKFEISPLYADSEAALVSRWQGTRPLPALAEGVVLT